MRISPYEAQKNAIIRYAHHTKPMIGNSPHEPQESESMSIK